ncbi:pentapeptide repeat-containing protein [Rickettsiales bacterium]|nr:pentapeptide repeat-containing protein [Rickettsiales bacterium]
MKNLGKCLVYTIVSIFVYSNISHAAPSKKYKSSFNKKSKEQKINMMKRLNDTKDSILSSGKILDYIEEERLDLSRPEAVDVVARFKKFDSVEQIRFGNRKDVLNLAGLSFGGKDLSNVDLTMADMRETNLSRTNFRNSILVHVDFQGADLSYADFRNADLSNAIFEKANLEGTNFDGANLFNAEFKKVYGIRQKEITELNRRTIFYKELEKVKAKGEYHEEQGYDELLEYLRENPINDH